jgi:receptor-type tyrosine-protein phosphatase gamma
MEVPLIEGPLPGTDTSYKFFYSQCEDLKEIEKGIPITEFSDHLSRRNIDIEFTLMGKITMTKRHELRLIPNASDLQKFNRYSDVLPFSDTKVTVSTKEYINANWIQGHNSCPRFIATQGPLDISRNSFWKMIWEHDVSLIVMVTAIRENGKQKCDQYFPLEGTLSTADFEITLKSISEEFATLTLREFDLVCDGEVKTIKHLQSIAWPDHGAPELDEEYQSIKYMIDEILESRSPVLVHCSAGIGRTGTLISLCQMIHAVQMTTFNPRVSVFGTVRRLREQRWKMVQTKNQYDFLYKFMEEWVKNYINE